MKYIEHITLNSGHTRRSPREEVRDETIARIQPWITDVAQGRTVTLFEDEGFTLHGVVQSKWGVVFLEDHGAPLITLGVCWHSRDSASVWRELHDQVAVTVATFANQPPSVPWCAARLEPASLAPGMMPDWVGDFERCIAWAMIER